MCAHREVPKHLGKFKDALLNTNYDRVHFDEMKDRIKDEMTPHDKLRFIKFKNRRSRCRESNVIALKKQFYPDMPDDSDDHSDDEWRL
jgi:hypothetical protein